jgi:hypothetical protein
MGRDDEQRQPADVRGEELEQRERGAVGPVDVLEDEHRRLRPHAFREPCDDGVGLLEPRDLGGIGRVECRKLAPRGHAAQDLPPRPQLRRAVHCVALPEMRRDAGGSGVGRNLLDQARFADPRLTSDEDRRAAPAPRIGEGRVQQAQLGLAANERRRRNAHEPPEPIVSAPRCKRRWDPRSPVQERRPSHTVPAWPAAPNVAEADRSRPALP